MRKQAGFTLIELVIVIVILGILAVTAAPKFLNLQDDAKEAAAQGVMAAVKSGAQIVYGKAAIEGKERATSDAISINGEDIAIAFGYPQAGEDGIGKAVDVDSGWVAVGTGFLVSGAQDTDPCVYYTNAEDAQTPAEITLGQVAGTSCVSN
ncbi:type II secretion system protein [Aeromonas sp. 164P]